MGNQMRRPDFRARIQWHTWMPWYEFSRTIGEMQDLDERAFGMLLPVLGLALGTLAVATLIPQLSLLVTGLGGGAIVYALTRASGDGRRIARGVRVVGLPSPRVFMRLTLQMAVDDARALWLGRPRPAALLAGPDESTIWTRAETIDRYHLWCAVRDSLPPADRAAARIAMMVGFEHEELMDALTAHRLHAADLDAGRQIKPLLPMLELKLLGLPETAIRALTPAEGGANNEQHSAAGAIRDLAVLHGAAITQGDEDVPHSVIGWGAYSGQIGDG